MAEWIKVSVDLPTHPKTIALARLLGVSRREATGLVVELLIYGYSHADINGALRMTPDDLDAVLGATKRRAYAIALTTAGFIELDGDGLCRIHDFYEFAGKLIVNREKDKARKSVKVP